MRKRLLAMTTALCLLMLSMITISVGAQEAVNCKQEAAILAAVGVLDGAAADAVGGNPTEAMQRGEYTAHIVHLMGMETGIDGTVFSDVPASMEYAPEIMAAYQMELVHGYGNGTFGPNEPITTGEAMKILIGALGYAFHAQNRGGYPAGYMMLASELGVSRNLSLAAADELTKGEAVIMLYNALEIDLSQAVTVGSETTLIVTEGRNALTEFLEYDVVEGVVTQTAATGLSSPGEAVEGNRVGIDNVIYDAGATDAANYLGYRVKAYCQDNAHNTDRLVYVAPYRTEEITIDGAEILSFDNRVLNYEQSNGTRTLKKHVTIPITADVVYNGVACLDYTDADFVMEEGGLTLLDNNTDGEIDVVLLNVTYNRVVNSVNRTDKIIYTRSLQGKIDLSELEADEIRIVDANGNALEFDALKADDVLTVAGAKDGSRVSLVVSTEREAGEINEKHTDKNEAMINYYLRKISVNFRPEFETLPIGHASTFLFDAQGRVAGIASGGAMGSKAYGIVGGIMQKKSIDLEVQIQIYTAEGVLETMTVADKIEADGFSLEAGDFYQEYTLASGGGRYFDPDCRVVKFGKNADGKLNYLDTKREDKNGNLETSLKEMDCRNLNSGQGVRWKNSTRSFSASVLTDANTIFFNMPVVESGDPAQVNSFAAKSYSNSVALTDNIYYQFRAYDVDDGGYSPLIVMETGYSADDPIGGTAGNAPALDSTFVMVDHISNVVNAEGEPVPKLYFSLNGNIVGYEALNENVIKKGASPDKAVFLRQGDIIRYKINADNVLVGTAVEWDMDAIGAGSFVMQSGNDNGKAIGQVYSQKNGNIKISTTAKVVDGLLMFLFEKEKPEDPEVSLYVYPVGNTNITVFDTKEEEIYAGNAGDIVDYKSDPGGASIVFVQTKWYEMRQVFIIK